jgi:ribosomal protein S4
MTEDYHTELGVGYDGMWLPKALELLNMVESTSEGCRVLKQGAVSVGGKSITDPWAKLLPGKDVLVCVGKRSLRVVTDRREYWEMAR